MFQEDQNQLRSVWRLGELQGLEAMNRSQVRFPDLFGAIPYTRDNDGLSYLPQVLQSFRSCTLSGRSVGGPFGSPSFFSLQSLLWQGSMSNHSARSIICPDDDTDGSIFCCRT